MTSRVAIFILLLLAPLGVQAQQTIDHRDYWGSNVRKVFRRSDGLVYLGHTLVSQDLTARYLPYEEGAVTIVLHDYFARLENSAGQVEAGSYQEPTPRFYGDSWHLRLSADGSVVQYADSFRNDGVVSESPVPARANLYHGQGIKHGGPECAFVGGVCESPDIYMWLTPNPAQSMAALDLRYRAYSWARLEAILPTYTPAYCHRFGAFGPGPSGCITYSNVIVMRFRHGVRNPAVAPKTCPNRPDSFPRRPGFGDEGDFEQILYLAPGIGIIRTENTFYGPGCFGSHATDGLPPTQENRDLQSAWLSEFEFTPAPAEISVTTFVHSCNQVGYPLDQFVGSYQSRCVGSECAAGIYTRLNSCEHRSTTPSRAPNTFDYVQVNTCQEVGYPPGVQGSYTSRVPRSSETRSLTTPFWERIDTCR